MSEKRGDGTIVETTIEARGGVTPHLLRYVLAGSLILVIVAFAIVLYTAS